MADEERLGIGVVADPSGIADLEDEMLASLDRMDEAASGRVIDGPTIRPPEVDTTNIERATERAVLFREQIEDITHATPALTLAFQPLSEIPTEFAAAEQTLQRFGATLADLSTTAARSVGGTSDQAKQLARDLAEASNLITTLPEEMTAGADQAVDRLLEISSAVEDVVANMQDLGAGDEVASMVQQAAASITVLRSELAQLGQQPVQATVTARLDDTEFVASMNRLQKITLEDGTSDALGKGLDPGKFLPEVNRLADLVAQGLERAPEHLSRALSTSVSAFLGELRTDVATAFAEALEARGIIQVPVRFTPETETETSIPVKADTTPLEEQVQAAKRAILAQPPIEIPVAADPAPLDAVQASLAATTREAATATETVGLFERQLKEVGTVNDLTIAFKGDDVKEGLEGSLQTLQRFGATLADVAATFQHFGDTSTVTGPLATELKEAVSAITGLPEDMARGSDVALERLAQIERALEGLRANLAELGGGDRVAEMLDRAVASVDDLQTRLEVLGQIPITPTVTPRLNEQELFDAFERLSQTAFAASAQESISQALRPENYVDDVNRLADLVAQGLERAPEQFGHSLSQSAQGFVTALPQEIAEAFTRALAERGVIEVPFKIVPDRETSTTIPVQADTEPFAQTCALAKRKVEETPVQVEVKTAPEPFADLITELDRLPQGGARAGEAFEALRDNIRDGMTSAAESFRAQESALTQLTDSLRAGTRTVEENAARLHAAIEAVRAAAAEPVAQTDFIDTKDDVREVETLGAAVQELKTASEGAILLRIDPDAARVLNDALVESRTNADLAAQNFAAFSESAGQELRELGITGAAAAQTISVLWDDMLRGKLVVTGLIPDMERLSALQIKLASTPPQTDLIDTQADQDAVDRLTDKVDQLQGHFDRLRGTANTVDPTTTIPRDVFPTVVPADMPEAQRNFAILATGLADLGREAETAAAKFASLREEMTLSGTAARRAAGAADTADDKFRDLGGAVRDNRTAQAGLNDEVGRSVEHFASHGRAINTAANAMAAEAAQALELRGPLVQLSEALLDISLGNVAAIATFGAIAAMAVVWRQVNKAAHDAAQSEKEAVDAFIKRTEAAQLDDATLRARLRFRVAESEQQREGLELVLAQGKAELSITKILAAKFLLLLNINKAREAENALQDSERQAAKTAAENLEAAHLTRIGQFIQDRLAMEQAGHQAEEQDLRQALARQEITAAQFAERRSTIERRRAADDIFALHAQRDADIQRLEAKPPSAAVRQERAAIEDHLQAAIRLRERQLNTTLDQLRADREAAREKTLEDAGLGVGAMVAPTELTIRLHLRQVDPAEVDAAVDRVQEALDNIKVDDAIQKQFERDEVAARQLNEMVNALSGTITDLLQNAEDLNIISQEAQIAAESIFNIVKGVKELEATREEKAHIAELPPDQQAAATMANEVRQLAGTIALVSSAISAATSIFHALFGGGESEHDRIVRENTEAIKRNTAAQEVQELGLGGLEEKRATIAQLAEEDRARRAEREAEIQRRVQAGETRQVVEIDLGPPVTDLRRELDAAGISLEELQAIADQFDLTVVDEQGHIVASELAKLDEQIKHSIEMQFQWQDTFDDLQRRQRLESRLAGTEQTPEEEFRQSLQAAIDAGSGAIEDAFKGVDLGDPVAVRQRLQQLEEAFASGTIAFEDIGHLTRDQWLGFLEQGADFLDTFNQGLKEFNDLNIPEGFRRAQLAFEAGNRGTPVPEPPPEPPVPQVDPHTNDRGVVIDREAIAEANQNSREEQTTAEESANETTVAVQDSASRIVDAVSDSRDTLELILRTLRGDSGPGSSGVPENLRPNLRFTPSGPPTGAGRTVTIHGGLHIPVVLPSGAAAPGAAQQITVDAVRAALRQIGLVQTGDTLQFPVY